MLKLPWTTEATPATAPVSPPSPMPATNPVATVTPSRPETVNVKRARKPAKKPAHRLYPVLDRRGVVVGTSATPAPQETAETHAAAFLEWLLREHDGYAGRPVLHDVAASLYEAFCSVLDLKPFPWRAVARAFGELPGVTRANRYVDTNDWRKRVKRLMYILPDVRAAVVELDVARKCA